MSISPPRICDLGTMRAEELTFAAQRAAAIGFSHVAVDDDDPDAVAQFVETAASLKLDVLVNLNLSQFSLDHPKVLAHPNRFAVRHTGAPGETIDPRNCGSLRGYALARFYENPECFVDWWTEILLTLQAARARGFRLFHPQNVPRHACQQILARTRTVGPDTTFVADTIGLTRDELAGLSGCGFDYSLSSLPWWDLRSPWLAEEYEAAIQVAPMLACVEGRERLPPVNCRARRERLALSAITGMGVMMPARFAQMPCDDDSEPDCDSSIRAMNDLVASDPIIARPGALRILTGPGAPVTVLLRGEAADLRACEHAMVARINPDFNAAAKDIATDGTLGDWELASPPLFGKTDDRLAPGEVRVSRVHRRKPVRISARAPNRDVANAAKQARIVIGNISPAVDGGLFPAKRIVGDTVIVEADTFADGHPLIAAELLFRADDEKHWRRVAMRPLGNDRFAANLTLLRIGRHRFAIEAWIDNYGGFARDLTKKHAVGNDISVDLMEGLAAIETAAERTTSALHAPLMAIASAYGCLDAKDKLATLLAPETLDAMRHADARSFRTQSATHVIDCDRPGARFASWYELFPRSQTSDPTRHGTFRDVIARLPAIRAMGFDVLYLPPVHPIGTTNRKGRNNSLLAKTGDPGSVYAIGSDDGGHDAVHPELGTIGDFRTLVSAARHQGMEIALDFAVQCSPDHPWLRVHPGWFDWRADGSIKYAENPPKLYEDIVNVDFYGPDAIPGLWLALRDIVLFWAKQGVRIFRVDNPHTKPFGFWQWLIADVRAVHPDMIFLSEAFTRPKIMYHLAKLGFTQSYTYFTWRSTKPEFIEYMRELTAPQVADFFRPHFFVNTPDINPFFLQRSGRAGFLIRAALGGTLSGLWGINSGFELCEADAVPGREEYLDSEKYAIKPRDWNAPGNIIAEITQINRVRKSEPALQSHLHVTFYNAFNPNVLYFGKQAPGENSRILVAINLNPHDSETAEFEIPLWEWGLPDSGSLEVADLLSGARFVWHGKMQHIQLAPEAPYRIWRIWPAEA